MCASNIRDNYRVLGNYLVSEKFAQTRVWGRSVNISLIAFYFRCHKLIKPDIFASGGEPIYIIASWFPIPNSKYRLAIFDRAICISCLMVFAWGDEPWPITLSERLEAKGVYIWDQRNGNVLGHSISLSLFLFFYLCICGRVYVFAYQ